MFRKTALVLLALRLWIRPVVPNWGAIYSAQGCRGLTRFFTISIHFQTVIKPQSKLLWVP